MRSSITLAAVFAVAVSGGCTANNLCNRLAECADDNDRDVSDDAPAVCAADLNTQQNSLRANEEPECSALAAAIDAVNACRAGLSCDDLEESDLGRECDDQLDALEDAVEDTDGVLAGFTVVSVGERCTAQEN
ncbi:MAG TPA: hypothetical protein VGF99_08230 [Myxococcota bacterium]